MQNSLKIILLVIGVAFVGFGLYNVFTPEKVFEAGPFSVNAQSDSIDIQNIVIMGIGILALVAALFSKKK